MIKNQPLRDYLLPTKTIPFLWLIFPKAVYTLMFIFLRILEEVTRFNIFSKYENILKKMNTFQWTM